MALFPGALCPWVEMRFLSATGEPLVGGQLYSYVVGTSTPQATYTDVDLLVPHANPIVLDAAGRPASPIYLSPNGYKFILHDADDDEVWTLDKVEDIGQVFASTFGLVLSGGGKNVVSGYTVVDTDRLVTVDSTGGADPCLINLLAAADALQPVTVKNLGDVVLAVTPDGSDTIDGLAAAYTVPVAVSPLFPAITLVSDGVSSWYIVSSHGV